MRAIRYHQFGCPSDVLQIEKVEMPLFKDNEVLVQMQLRSINPSDLLTIRGRYPSRIKLPAIPGYEGVGVIVDKGTAVTDLLIGQRVLGLGGIWSYTNKGSGGFLQSMQKTGTWQEYVAMNAETIVPVPNEIDGSTAAQLYINPLTAWLMLKYELKLRKGDIFIANACGSAIGRLFAEFALIFGYELIGVTRSDAYDESLNQLGVKKVINTAKVPLVETLLAYTRGRKVTAALDAVGGKDGVELAHCVQEGGTMLLYGLLSGEQHPHNIHAFLSSSIKIKNYRLRDWVLTTPLKQRISIFLDMIDHFVRYQISLPSGPIFDLAEIKKAVESAELLDRTGKVLLSG
ncbi:MAG: zinc-dependent alcohol dehydrogenase family protein [Parachlamydiaceae bacterium]|nr:zinc-dependent alcohol dehydrogenase family protein [Parachlamydiaceae bacterium]